MEFKFDANQEFQIEAIEAAAGILEGQPPVQVDMTFSLDGGFAAVSNGLDLDEKRILMNLNKVQAKYGIEPDDSLKYIEEMVDTASGKETFAFPNFSVEMETGTGKTYVYIRTALELYRRYGQRKFIVVVPSVAVREGVLKTLKMTEKHFKEIFNNPPYRYYVYDSSKISQIRQFALSDGVEIMIMTLDSFNKAANVIRQTTDRLQGETPIFLIQTARPILILDEPQNMESEKSVAALAALKPLFALRYSATHKNHYNLVYRLTPYEAYRQGLVKKIEVASTVKEDDFNKVFLKLIKIESKKNTITAQIAVHKMMKDGTVKEQVITVKPGDSLREKTGRPEYEGYTIEEINPGSDTLYFANGVEITTGESKGADKEAIFEAQIHYTVEEHFRKQKRLKDQGIKVLSLFFIDRVANYRSETGDSGIIRRIFDRIFNDAKKKHPEWMNVNPDQVQAAYFARKKNKSGEVIFEDSTTGKAKKDEEAYNLIMKEKERLLSFEEPVSFIFSHSALKEGWDNPNVFQICTLNQTISDIKKRQEVGRGVRLAVDQAGSRNFDEKINVLTVVANESYEKYVENLQSEIEEAYGREGLPPKPANARKRGIATLRKEFTLKPEFKELWEKIKHKTCYAVTIDTGKLVEEAVREIEEAEIRPPRVVISKARIQVKDTNSLEAVRMSADKTALEIEAARIPDLIGLMTHLMEHTTPPVSLSKHTLLEIIRKSQRKQDIKINPHEFATVAVRIIKGKLADHLVNGIQYEKINEWYEMTQFNSEIESWEEYLIPSERSVYDNIVFDSGIEKEFVEGLNRRDDVKLFVKLPNWFTVPTPVGDYNPDWAIVMENRDSHGDMTEKDLLYLVRETKGTTDLDKLHPDEKRKIKCGKKHFKDTLGVDYKVVVTAKDLP